MGPHFRRIRFQGQVAGVRVVLGQIDRDGGSVLYSYGNIKQNNCGLKNRHPDQLLDQVIFGDHCPQANKKENDINKVIQPLDQQLIEYGSFLKHLNSYPAN